MHVAMPTVLRWRRDGHTAVANSARPLCKAVVRRFQSERERKREEKREEMKETRESEKERQARRTTVPVDRAQGGFCAATHVLFASALFTHPDPEGPRTRHAA